MDGSPEFKKFMPSTIPKFIGTNLEQKINQFTQETFNKATVLCTTLEQEGHNRHALDLIHIFSSLRTLINELRGEVGHQRDLADLLRSRIGLWEKTQQTSCPHCYRQGINQPTQFQYIGADRATSIRRFCPICRWETKII